MGGLPSNVTETDLRTFFSRYGKVMEVVIMYDQEKKKSRGNIQIFFFSLLTLNYFRSLNKHKTIIKNFIKKFYGI